MERSVFINKLHQKSVHSSLDIFSMCAFIFDDRLDPAHGGFCCSDDSLLWGFVARLSSLKHSKGFLLDSSQRTDIGRCVWDHCHVAWESSFHSVFVQSCIHSTVYKCHLLLRLVLSCSLISAPTPTSVFQSQHSTVTEAKHAGSHLIQTHFILVSSDQRRSCQHSTFIRLLFIVFGEA